MNSVGAASINDKLKINAYTKLMEQVDVYDGLRLPQLETAGIDISEITVLTDQDGCDIVFANDSGRGIFCYYYNNVQPSHNVCYVPLKGKMITAGIAADGSAHVFALRDDKVFYSKETYPHSCVFEPETQIKVTLPKHFKGISQIEAIQIQEGFALFVVCETIGGTAYVSRRISGDAYDYLMPVTFSAGKFGFSGTSKDSLFVHQVYTYQRDSFYSICQVGGSGLEIYGLDFPVKTEVTDIVLADEDIFCQDTDSRLWQITIDKKEVRLRETFESVVLQGICFERNDNELHGAGVSANNRLLHFKMSPDAEGGYNSTIPFPIDQNVSAVSFSRDTKNITLYHFEKQSYNICRLSYDPISENWNEMELTLPDPGEVQRQSCYATELTLLDAEKRTPLIEVEVDIWTEQRAYIKTVDGFHLCDKDNKLRMKTNASGKVSFAQYVNKVDAPVVYASLPENLMSNEECLAFRQFETVSRQLEGIDADTILNAKTTDSMGSGQGNLLPDQYRNKENAEAIANSINQIMQLETTMNDCPSCRGTYIVNKNEIGILNRIAARGDLPAWSLRVEGDRLNYSTLTGGNAEARINELRKQSVYLDESGFNSIFSSIGDFFRGVAKKIAKVVEVVVKGIKTAVQFVIDGIKYVYECVVKTIDHVLSMIQTIFAAVAVFFITLFMWLAALFQWEDVKRAQKVICGSFEIFMESFSNVSKSVKDKVIACLKDFQNTLDEKIDKVCAEFIPGIPLMTYINENTPSNEEGEEAVSNNYLMDKFLSSNSSNLMMLDNAAVLEYRSALNDIMDIINRFADEISASEEFSEASKYFEEAFSSLDGLFNNLMISILLTLKGLLHLLFSGFISIISAVFDAFEEITSLILRTLTKKINIPFFSNLYKLMIGDDLTPLNLIGFISATTSVTLSKIITGHTLFEDDKDVDEALESCRAVFSTVNRGNRVYTSKKVKQVFTIMSFYFATFYFIVSAWQDWQAAVTLPEPEPKPPDPEPEPKPPDPEPEPKPPEPKPKPKQINLIDVGALGLEMLWLIFSAPWFYDSKEEPAEYNDIVLWGWFFVGFGIDGFFLILEHSHIDKIKKGREITSFYGFVHLVLTAVFTGIKKTKAEECVPEFCGCVAEMSKFLVNLDSKRTWSRWIVPPIDGVTAVSLFLCELITVP